MKISHLKALKQNLAESASHIYLIISKDSFQRKQAQDLIVNHLLKEEKNKDLCLKVFTDENFDMNRILDEMQGLSFFTPKQIFVIQNAEKLTKPLMDKFNDFFMKPTPGIYLILLASSLAISTILYKKTEGCGVILDIPEEKPWEKERSLQAWVKEYLAANDKSASPQVCLSLIKWAGTDISTLHQELEKLICYAGDRKEITDHDITAICSSVNSETGWQLGEAIFRRDAGTALRISKSLLEDGTHLLPLLRQIRSQFHTQLQICSILDSGGSITDIQKKFPYLRGSLLDRHLQIAKNYGLNKCKEGLLKIDQTELNSKNSAADPDLLCELLLVKLTT